METGQDGVIDRASAPAQAAAAAGPIARLARSHARTLLVGGLGAGAAAAYAYFVGCHTGTCPLTSNVWTASLYGALVGAVVGWPSRAR